MKNKNDADAEEVSSSASPVPKAQGRKRKRHSSDSSNNDELILPDNALETERNVHASAMKNNLDETSVRKIIKKVVTNDHVLALVKLREEEENSASDDKALQPKLTRAKVKELKKVSPKSAPWNLENLELTPIKHIPVKTRPEVKALIAQELPEDEDDDEYEPTHDDVPSDDEHTESCSDLESQPRTPATPAAILPDSPQVVKDGPFKVPQDVLSARRKLQIEEEEATIALRTRSKLSLSATSIEHIESTFIPPDDLPVPDVDDLWNDFLTGCLDPASNSKHEDDDEADPEYNVAADQDAQEEDEETLGNSLIKISKKELNDLVTELFNIMPNDQNITDTMNTSVLSDASHNETRWEGKQEPTSDYEKPSQRLRFEEREYKSSDKKIIEFDQSTDQQNTEKPDKDPKVGYNFSREPLELNFIQDKQKNQDNGNAVEDIGNKAPRKRRKKGSKNKMIEISIEEGSDPPAHLALRPPASLLTHIHPEPHTVLKIEVTPCLDITPEQILILQQQVRQHVQLATSNFLQLFVHPVHWKLAPTYKDYLESLMNLVKNNEKSVVNVCNLKKAHELVLSWEEAVSKDTPENRKMIEFIQSEVARTRRRIMSNALCVGEFHETFKEIICNSSVFLYPYLLPAMPYRPDFTRRFAYLQSEDALIVLGLDQFWTYVDANPKLFKRWKNYALKRRGLSTTLSLVVKHMFPWTTVRTLMSHIFSARTTPDNPIYNYFKHNELPKTEHRLLPYNPDITLYSQPEHEMPKIWVRYLAKSSKRFRSFHYSRPNLSGRPPDGVSINPGVTLETKKPLPIDFTRIMNPRLSIVPLPPKPVPQDNYDITILHEKSQEDNSIDLSKDNSNCTDVMDLQQNEDNLREVVKENRIEPSKEPKNYYKLVQTNSGSFLVPLQVTQTVNSSDGPITTPAEVSTEAVSKQIQPNMVLHNEHCTCCIILRQICKEKQTRITDYFKSKHTKKRCYCSDIKHPKISKRLKLLVLHNKNSSEVVFNELQNRLEGRSKMTISDEDFEYEDIMYVYRYELNVFMKSSICRRISIKRRFYTLLSHFNLESGSPITLAKELAKTFDVELVDLYQDFLGFLTPQQADEIGRFRDYFTRNCAKELMDKIEAEVSDKQTRNQMLGQLKECFSSDKSACEMCTALLYTMREWPKLALHTFHMFPHRKESWSQTYVPINVPVQKQQPAVITEEQTQNTVHNNTEHSSSEEDSEPIMCIDINRTEQSINEICLEIKEEPQTDDRLDSDVTIDKTDYDSETTISVYDIKSEDICHWRREEDKIVLEVLQKHLTTEERNAKTILELLEDKNVYEFLSQSLTDRSLPQIKERVKHILSLLAMTESNKM